MMIVLAAVLFVPAGSFRFWQGWAYMAVILVPTLASSIYFYRHDPALMERRMQTEEKVGEQKLIRKLGKLIFFAAFAVPGLDYRFGWSRLSSLKMPLWLIITAEAGVLAGYLFTLWVMKTNTFASSIIEVQAEQRVISSGPYAMVRHPMYFGSLAMLLSTPLALGSYWALPVFLLMLPVLVFRILNEEKVLCHELPGYPEYCQHTRYRLIPFVW